MDSHNTVVDLPTISVPLTTDPHGLPATLGGPGLVHAPNRLRMGVVFGDDLLTAIPEFFFIPLD